MTNNLAGTKTEQNIMQAFTLESEARNKYTFFADQAKKDGYEQIAAILEDTANNERAHAELLFKQLHNHEMPKTDINLEDAIKAEHFEGVNMYPEFERVAREEGFEAVANMFKELGEIENMHEKRFKALLDNVSQKLVFSKDGDAVWMCRNCGHIVIGKDAPLACPVCQKPQAYFEIKNENY